MDSERRHELDQNTLAQALTKAPTFLWEYGSYLLLAIAVIVALYFFFRTRSTSELQKREAESASLFNMTTAVEGARDARQFASFLSAKDVADRQAQVVAEFEQFADLPATSARPGVRAHAARLRGDLAWTLATFPAPRPAPPTQPTTGPSTLPATRPSLEDVLSGANDATARTPEEWLQEAETAYREVVDNYSSHTADNLAALFGLAAVAEQRGDFKAAVGYYERLLARDDVGAGAKTLATQRKAMAGTLGMSPRLAPPRPVTQPSTQPTTQSTTRPAPGEVDPSPAGLGPAPSTAPATRPAE